MALVLQAPEDLVNAAIVRLGGKRRIGSLFDGTEESRAFLDIYGQTRDALLRMGDWEFAIAYAAGVLIGGAAFPWLYQYAYPSDALKIRSVFNQAAYAADKNNPVPVDWRPGNAVISGTPTEVVLTNTPSATLCYMRQVTNPAVWEANFAEAVIAGLAKRAGSDPNMRKMIEADEAEAVKAAEMVQG